ncbi:UNVERIFIED_CONTAM: hypothetical protein PYX00_004136 [Menopon gallinae]|uniref:polo kinase n=1 Tax=Menopon gallinae TaxID=328185 RepID=A0AAW2I4G9_9NEOP
MKVMNIQNSAGKGNGIVQNKGRNREVKIGQVMKEVNIHNMMRHKNVVRLEAHFLNDSKFYMIMEHCEMNNLAQLLRTYKRFSESETRNFLKQILAGLQHIHERGIIHRDLKPANIYVTRDLVLKIGDFGLADRVRTESRGICGTPNYISPEVLNEQGYTTAVDIWAAGCITYHMVTGRPPFEADNQQATYELIRTHRFSPISPSQAGAALRHLVNWMLAFRPEDRPSIPFIFGHTWMKRTRKESSPWPKCRKRRRNTPSTVPLADLRSEDSAFSDTQASTESDKRSGKREVSLWKHIFEKAKVPSYEDVNSTSVFHRFGSRRYSGRSGKHKEDYKKCIEEVLRGVPFRVGDSEFLQPEDEPLPVFVSKWIDYSNKYGFGYEMTDGTCGVFFGDRSQITLDGSKTCITWSNKGKRTCYPVDSIPERLRENYELLNYFAEYMDSNLSNGFADVRGRDDDGDGDVPTIIRHWTRNDKVILFEMIDGSVQINFFQDHCKFLIFHEYHKAERQVILITVDEEKKIRRYNLTEMGRSGCPEDILNHLIYIRSLL